ncbi:MAG: hypothetical protein LBD59_05465 [Prevotellaceae bacterium]|jgi:hypothetical protein|nr:hypothetical protein [Prevotellaceae bacterium]
MTKLSLLTIVLIMFATTARTQEFSAGADIVSSYVWRGLNLSGTSIQPSLGFSAGNFSVGAWGSVDITGFQVYKELDLTVGYQFAGFSIGVTDYWIAPEGSVSYFNYSDTAAHTFEATLGYTLPCEKFPLSLSWSTNFAGFDGVKSNGDVAWSSYFEIACPFTVKSVALTAALGLTPWETDFYGAGGFAVINTSLKAVKELKIGEFTLPVSVQAILNPRAENAFLVFGISF